ncbi:MAG: hypothetical protein QM809_05320 [Gordonia sp. (in: high G+C Gram-positive bacteria)]|uniref:hypothetical protein n=1 Tax=Gordonia sp. (in: high G+C Gram-positive bacteria) TaxID=84139 RepID=UPI0039E5C585
MTAQAWVTLMVGLPATIGVVGTLWQRQHSEQIDREHRLEIDSRSEWWRRFQWAAEQSVAQNPEARLLGRRVLRGLLRSSLLTGSEREIAAMLVVNRAEGEEVRDDADRGER